MRGRAAIPLSSRKGRPLRSKSWDQRSTLGISIGGKDDLYGMLTFRSKIGSTWQRVGFQKPEFAIAPTLTTTLERRYCEGSSLLRSLPRRQCDGRHKVRYLTKLARSRAGTMNDGGKRIKYCQKLLGVKLPLLGIIHVGMLGVCSNDE